jgi:hypothetical protein
MVNVLLQMFAHVTSIFRDLRAKYLMQSVAQRFLVPIIRSNATIVVIIPKVMQRHAQMLHTLAKDVIVVLSMVLVHKDVVVVATVNLNHRMSFLLLHLYLMPQLMIYHFVVLI